MRKLKPIIITLTVIIILLLSIISYNYINKEKEYSKNLFYMDTYIYVKIYEKDKTKANKILNEIEQIYKEYHQLSDRYNEYDNINNLYYIHNNTEESEYIEIDSRLYDMIEYGIYWYDKSDGLIDISMGNVIDVWKKYRESKNGVPTIEELNNANNNTNAIILKDNNLILNNHANIDLGAISKGYATNIVKEYLEENNIDKYLINAGGTVVVGDNYKNSVYKIGLEDPNNNGDIYKIIKGNNISVVTSGGYERFYEYNGKKYHHIINPKNLMPPENMKSVSIICQDSKLGDILSTMLFLMSIEDGKEYIETLEGVEAIWYTNDNKIITSDGVYKYE